MMQPLELAGFLEEVAQGYLLISEELNRLESESTKK